jgi:hypothetical protein
MIREEQIKDAATDYGYLNAGGGSLRPAYCAGFCDGAKWADDNRTWISVKDELPQEHIDVLVFDKYGTRAVAYYCNEEGEVYWDTNDDELSTIFEDVLYWMPLPDRPKRR